MLKSYLSRARVVKSVDTADLKSAALKRHAGSIPASGTMQRDLTELLS